MHSHKDPAPYSENHGTTQYQELLTQRQAKRRRTLLRVLVSICLYLIIMSGFIYLILKGAETMGYNWQWYQIPKYIIKTGENGLEAGLFLMGLWATIKLSALAFALAVVFGLAVAMLRLSNLIVGRALSKIFLELFRNTPLLVVLYLFYYVLGPVFGWDRFTASVMCLALFHAALISEIFRSGINAIPQGQWEAAYALGLTKRHAYQTVILPQSIPLILPPLTGEVVHMIKSSAVVSVIAVVELTTIGRNVISDTYMSFEVWFTIAALYFILTTTLSFTSSMIERKFKT